MVSDFQIALNSGLLDLRGMVGPFFVDIPPYPRTIATLTMPDGAKIIGDGQTIIFRGDPMGHDWAGIRVGNDWSITGINFVVDEPAGNWDEQSHVLEIVGPVSGGSLSHCTFSHPVVAGSSRGDCIRFRGYSDKRIWNQIVHHCTFLHAARSGIAVYGGLHGSRFHHLTFLDTSDQDFDCEGQGDIVDVEWSYNVHRSGPSVQSGLAVSLYPGSVHMHHCQLERALDILGGSHHIHHNKIALSMPSDDPVVYLRKAGGTRFHDEIWTRFPGAGPGMVFGAAQKITAPGPVTLEDVQIAQHTPRGSVFVSGVNGISFTRVTIADSGANCSVRDAIRIEGTSTTRTTPVVVSDCDFQSTFRSAVSVSGSYLGGVGSVEIKDCVTSLCLATLRQENIEPTATMGGISGPVTVTDGS